MGNIGKIYSRKRFIGWLNAGNKGLNSISNAKNKYKIGNNDNRRKYGSKHGSKYGGGRNKLKIQIIKIVIILIIIIALLQLIFYYFEPVFETMCEEKVKSLAILITNQQSTIIMNKYQYDELYTIEKDSNGNIVVIKSNVVPINNLISDLTENIQKEFDKIENPEIKIPLGSLSGIYFLSGSGPEISLDVSVTGTVDTEIKSEFVAQGINQTLHRVYVKFECHMKIVTPLKNYTKKVTNQVILAEHVIVGNIPNSYYNLEGIESRMDALNILE